MHAKDRRWRLIAITASTAVVFAVAWTDGAQRSADPPQVRLTRPDPAQGTVLSEYLDENTGRSIVVKGGTSQEAALDWLAKVTQTESVSWEQILASTVSAGAAKGLVAASGVWGDTEVTVSWGAPPRRDPPGSLLVSTLTDVGTGASIVVAGSDKGSLAKEWAASVNDAKTEADLNILIQAQHSRGLVGATTYIKGGFKVTTWWSSPPR